MSGPSSTGIVGSDTPAAPIVLAQARPPATTLAFLFTDIEGSTKLWESRSHVMPGVISRHDGLMRAAVERAGGHVFKTVGDAVCAAFPDVLTAVDGALACQRDIKADGFPETEGLRVRMAVHIGSVEMRDGDYFGRPLNRVARLLSLAHGEQLLVSGAAAALVRESLPPEIALIDLGSHKLRDLVEPEQVFQVQAPDLRSSFPPIRTASEQPNNLRETITTFIGRDDEIEHIAERLQKHRLVTIIGPGGIGKTRTALRVGGVVLPRFPDGVWFLELAQINDRQLVLETLAKIFGLSPGSGVSLLDMLLAFLKQKKALLIFDNCEHLIDAVAEIAEEILRDCPNVTALAVSRERLSIAGEHTYMLPSLGFPTYPERCTTAKAALTYSAVRLFVERGASVVDGFTLTDADAPAVAAICKRLDGLPLAIELAAARLIAMTPKELEVRLADRFRILTGGSRTALKRQQTLRALIDWSYDLLSEQEAQLFTRLAVFAGGCTVTSATAVAADEDLEAWEVTDLLASLVDKSLLTVDSSGSETRYRMLETTREYAAEKLRKSDEPDRRPLLGRYLAGLYANAEQEWATTGTEDWLFRYAADLDNLRAVLEWAFGADGDTQLGLELTSHSLRLMQELSLVLELQRWFETAVARIGDDTPLLVKARLFFGMAAVLDPFANPATVETAQRAVALFRELDRPADVGMALIQLGSALLTPEGGSGGDAELKEALGLLKPLGPTKHLATCLNCRGCLDYFAGNVSAGREAFEEAAAISRGIDDTSGLRMILNNIAEVAFGDGDVESAIASAQEVVEKSEASNDRKGLARARMNLAAYLLSEDRIDEAREAARESLRDVRDLKLSYFATILIEHLALIAAAKDDSARSARLRGYGEEWYRANERTRERTEQIIFEKTGERLASALADDELARLTLEGAAWSEERAMDEALKV